MLSKEEVIRERAEFARDVEYVQSITEDAVVQESMLAIDRHGKGVRGMFESGDDEDDPEMKELEEACEKIPTDSAFESEEIDRIVNSDKDMNIDDIMGISDGDEEDGALDLAEDILEEEDD